MKTELNQEEMETVRDILGVAWRAYSNDAGQTFRHIRLLKNFGTIKSREILCRTCIDEVIDEHAKTCQEYKECIKSELFIPCPEEHYRYGDAEEATWMINVTQVREAERKAAEKTYAAGQTGAVFQPYDNEILFNHDGREAWLEETFPDISKGLRFNPWMGFLCDKHIGSMKAYANRI